MLLTSLGLSLSATTSTEFQIAVNQRWSEQARYNAEAGVEFAKEFLTTIANWGTILPPARTAGTGIPWAANATPGAIPTDAPQGDRLDEWGNPSRNYENYSCDSRGFGRGYGVVLDDGSAEAPYQFKQTVGGLALNGAFTLWIRRPVRWVSDAGGTAETLQDYEGNNVLMLVAEGVAPFGNTSARSTNRASFIIEVLLSQGALGLPPVVPGISCGSRQGQAGGSAQGTNSAGCTVLTGATDLVTALSGAENLGTGDLK
jgi:hypothetical protein